MVLMNKFKYIVPQTGNDRKTSTLENPDSVFTESNNRNQRGRSNRKPNLVARFRHCLAAHVGTVLIALVSFGSAATAQDQVPFSFDLVPASDTIKTCLPNARAKVTVFPREEVRGVDSFELKASGLIANTGYTVFLTESAVSVGAVQYIGDFKANANGEGSIRVDTIVEEAFASVPVSGTRVRADLNHVVLWFADPAADDVCFAPGTGPITPFAGNGAAGAAVLSSKNFLPGAPIP
jgi:hypothetical protein